MQVIKSLVQCLKTKMDYLKRMYKGFDSLDEFNRIIQKFQKRSNKMNKVFQNLNTNTNSFNIYIVKLKQCFNICNFNLLDHSQKLEKSFRQILQKDNSLDEHIINSNHILQKDICTLSVSFLAQKNKIVSPINKIVADFFEYS